MRLYFKGTVSLLGIAGMLPMLHSSKLQVTGQVLQIQLVVTGSVASFNFFALPLQARKWGCMPNLERKGYTQLTVDYYNTCAKSTMEHAKSMQYLASGTTSAISTRIFPNCAKLYINISTSLMSP